MNTEEKDYAARARIGTRIAELRKARGLTQEELGRGVYLQQNSIARIELGKFNIGFDTLEKIAQFFGKQVDFICT